LKLYQGNPVTDFASALMNGSPAWQLYKLFNPQADRQALDALRKIPGVNNLDFNLQVDAGEKYAEQAQQYYVDRINNHDENTPWYEKAADWAGGTLSSLWTCDTSTTTFNVLSTALGASKGISPKGVNPKGTNHIHDNTLDAAEGVWANKPQAGVGRLDGDKLSRKEFQNLKDELNGYELNLDRRSDKMLNKASEKSGKDFMGGFDYGTGTVHLRKDATRFEAFHEMTHARQFAELGQQKYKDLGTYAREAHVFNEIWKNRREFNKDEVKSAIRYMRTLKIDKQMGRIN
jgi:Metallopeptidase toxin 4